MRAVVAVALAFLLLPGCTQPEQGPEPPEDDTDRGMTPPSSTDAETSAGAVTDTATPTGSATTSSSSPTQCPGSLPGHCAVGPSYKLWVYVLSPEPRELGVPLPHGDWCIAPEEWDLVNGTRSDTVSVELREVDRGKVLWITTTGRGHVTVSVDLAGRSECQTFRYDPWSTEPDPADGTLDILGEDATDLTVQVQEAGGYCYEYDEWEGVTAGRGWSSIPEGRGGMVCQ